MDGKAIQSAVASGFLWLEQWRKSTSDAFRDNVPSVQLREESRWRSVALTSTARVDLRDRKSAEQGSVRGYS
jgi:hypothetical protein